MGTVLVTKVAVSPTVCRSSLLPNKLICILTDLKKKNKQEERVGPEKRRREPKKRKERHMG